MQALTKTDFRFDKQKSVYHGKVRDVYNIDDDLLVMVATDRISAFDVVLPKGIPFKGKFSIRLQPSFWMRHVTSAPIGNSLRPTRWLPWDSNAKDSEWR